MNPTAQATAARCVAAAAAFCRGLPLSHIFPSPLPALFHGAAAFTNSLVPPPAPPAAAAKAPTSTAIDAFNERAARVSAELDVTPGTVIRAEALVAQHIGGLERLPLVDDGSCLYQVGATPTGSLRSREFPQERAVNSSNVRVLGAMRWLQAYVVASAEWSPNLDVQTLRKIVAEETTENELECYQAQSALVPFLQETLTSLKVTDLTSLKKGTVQWAGWLSGGE